MEEFTLEPTSFMVTSDTRRTQYIYRLRGDVEVHFPYRAYQCQVTYMNSVLEALQDTKNALLESPTGTGKTLCLLCASLAWRRHVETGGGNPNLAVSKNLIPKIFYSSRTHSQLKQVIRELKSTFYASVDSGISLKTCVLGSRDQLCVHPRLSSEQKGAGLNAACKSLVRKQTCSYWKTFRYNNSVSISTKQPTSSVGFGVTIPPQVATISAIFDIEEMKLNSKDSGMCPFYQSKDLQKSNSTDLVFVPYNYLLDVHSSKSLGVDLKNSIVIIDEGHNIERFCESSASIDFGNYDITHALDEVDSSISRLSCRGDEMHSTEGGAAAKDLLSSEPSNVIETYLLRLKQILCRFENVLLDAPLNQIDQYSKAREQLFPGSAIVSLLSKCGISTQTDYAQVAKSIDFALELIAEAAMATTTTGFGAVKGAGGGIGSTYLGTFLRLLDVVYGVSATKDIDAYYKMYIVEGDDRVKKAMGKSAAGFSNPVINVSNLDEANEMRCLHLWCFSPGVTMNDLVKRQAVRCILITSGTLSPIDTFSNQLEIEIPITVENSHVIDTKSQVFAAVLTKGPAGHALCSSFTKRNDPNYIRDLGQIVCNIARIVASKIGGGGILLAFHSYKQMELVVNSWSQTDIFGRIQRIANFFVEPKFGGELGAVFSAFTSSINKNRGTAILAAVCRGKVTEGVDFSDRQCRVVIVAGLPLPAFTDKRVVLKRQFLDGQRIKFRGKLDGNIWYSQEALRAVNQTIGRVIRHKNDFGAILLCDERFKHSNQINQCSKWMRGNIGIYEDFGPALANFGSFIDNLPDRVLVVNNTSSSDKIELLIDDQENSQKSMNENYIKPQLTRDKNTAAPPQKRQRIIETEMTNTKFLTANQFKPINTINENLNLNNKTLDFIRNSDNSSAAIRANEMLMRYDLGKTNQPRVFIRQEQTNHLDNVSTASASSTLGHQFRNREREIKVKRKEIEEQFLLNQKRMFSKTQWQTLAKSVLSIDMLNKLMDLLKAFLKASSDRASSEVLDELAEVLLKSSNKELVVGFDQFVRNAELKNIYKNLVISKCIDLNLADTIF